MVLKYFDSSLPIISGFLSRFRIFRIIAVAWVTVDSFDRSIFINNWKSGQMRDSLQDSLEVCQELFGLLSTCRKWFGGQTNKKDKYENHLFMIVVKNKWKKKCKWLRNCSVNDQRNTPCNTYRFVAYFFLFFFIRSAQLNRKVDGEIDVIARASFVGLTGGHVITTFIVFLNCLPL